MSEELHTTEQPSPRSDWKMRLVFSAIGFLVAAAGAGGWFYYYWRLQDVPPPPSLRPAQAYRSFAKIMAGPQVVTKPGAVAPVEPSSRPSDAPGKPVYHILERRHLDDFLEESKIKVLDELATAFPELPSVLGVQTTKSNTPAHRRAVIQLLEEAEKRPANQRPVIYFAADMVAQQIWCGFENKAECDQLRADFARYQLTLAGDELGRVFIYPHDLLWRLWREYPARDWGERAFVLLLNAGWDTSGTCAKGGDQTREVIRQGESFLQERPTSPSRGIVMLLVGEAYASRWSFSNEPAGGEMSDYVGPKEFQEGAEESRVKAIGYFEKVAQLAPGTSLSRYALEVLPLLREKQILDNYRFYCVYD
jgi:hypothetical protein